MLIMTAPRRTSRQRGFTIIELMIAMVAGLIVAGAAGSILWSTLRTSTNTVRLTRLNQDLRGTMNMVTHDLARAGAWGIAPEIVNLTTRTDLNFSALTGAITVTSTASGKPTPNNAFAAPFTSAMLAGQTIVFLAKDGGGVTTRYTLLIGGISNDNTITATVTGPALPKNRAPAGSWTVLNPFSTVTTNVTADCVLFTYDLDRDGLLDPNERFGYRFDAGEQAIEATTTAGTCAGGAGWENVTDVNTLRITAFGLTDVSANPATGNLLVATVREFMVSMAGQMTADAAADRTLQQAVKVRNNIFI